MILAIVPAAGRGSRLGGEIPKALITPPNYDKNLIQIAISKLLKFSDKVTVVVSPSLLSNSNWKSISPAGYLVQEKPTGMGDAIFVCKDEIESAKIIVIVWADQIGISEETITNAIMKLTSEESPSFVIPSIQVKNPYVEYVWLGNKLMKVLQSREGEKTNSKGFTDVGCFVLTGGKKLTEMWDKYCKLIPLGELTNERNFIPFFKYLSDFGWHGFITNAQQNDRIGINTPSDLKKLDHWDHK